MSTQGHGNAALVNVFYWKPNTKSADHTQLDLCGVKSADYNLYTLDIRRGSGMKGGWGRPSKVEMPL